LRHIRPVAWLALLTLVTACGADAPRPATRPAANVLLITMDTTRADYIGCWGMSDVRTPAMDALADGGVRYANNIAPSQCTNPSHTSIMTGLYLARHGVYDNQTPLSGEALTLAEILSAGGYATLGAVSARHLNPDNSAFDQGFDTFLPCEPVSMDAGARNADFLPGLQGLAEGDRPFFAWVHYFDPHGDYDPPAPWDAAYQPGDRYDPVPSRRSMESRRAKAQEMVDPDAIIPLYKGEISYLDTQIAEVLAVLDRAGVADNTLVVLVADHGESMAEKEIYFCHAGMYNQVLHVPLVMRMPGVLPAGHVVTARSSSVDIMPTVLDLLGVDLGLNDLSGLTLRPTFDDPAFEVHQYIFSEAVRGVIRAVYDGEHKFIKPYPKDWAMPEKRLYDFAGDYWEEHDLKDARPDVAARLEQILDGWVERAQQRALPRVADHDLDPRTEKALRSLGYID
jgi:arylsulfatase A-like enzyme